MINIQTVTSASLYVIGTWTSPVLKNSLANFPTGTTSEWGALSWTEANTGTGFDGFVRIDILNASTGSPLISDIAQNTDLSPTDLSKTAAATSDIQIVVKLFAKNGPTPIVTDLWIKYKNWIGKMATVNSGKNVLLARAYAPTPTMSQIGMGKVGTGQTNDISESDTDLMTPLSSSLDNLSSPVVRTADQIIQVEYVSDGLGTNIPDGTVFDAFGFYTLGSSQTFCAGARFGEITAPTINPDNSGAHKIHFKGSFKLWEDPTNTTSVFTNQGKNVFINRAFFPTPFFSGISSWVAGTCASPAANSTALDSVLVGPNPFTYSGLDTSMNKLSLQGNMGSTIGNGSIFTAVGTSNGDSPALLTSIGLFDLPISKNSIYTYLFTFDFQLNSPPSWNIG